MGDGNSSFQLSPFHTYINPGFYDVSLRVHGPLNSDTLSRTQYIEVYDESPVITSIDDVPDDQGGQVLLRWNPSGWDGPAGATITQYSLWEEYNGEWININTSMASQNDSYVFLANTFHDSTSENINWSKFKVYAHTQDPSIFYESLVDSGYSIDNVPPQTPSGLIANLGDNGVNIAWGDVEESNFMYYNLYRNGDVIAQITETNFIDSYIDSQTPHYYRVTAVDDAGNESPPSIETMVNVTDLNWFINIRAEMINGSSDYYNFIGASEDASSEFDEGYDIIDPPNPPGNYISISFPHLDWENILGSNYSQDVQFNHELTDTMQTWFMNIQSNVSDSVILGMYFNEVPDVPVIIEHIESGERALFSDSSWFGFNILADSLYEFKISLGDTTPPSLSINQNMNGPQILIVDSTYSFTWDLMDGNGIDSVLTYYSLNDGASYDLINASSGYSDSLVWTIPDDTTLSHQARFKITVKDYSGNWTDDESNYSFTIVGDSLDKAFEPGWSLWGPPLTANESILSDLISMDTWYSYGYEDNGYIFDSTVSTSHGYWLGLTDNANINLNGTPLDQAYTKPLELGWNLISNPLVRVIQKDSLILIKENQELYFSEAVTEGWVNSLYGYDSLGYFMAEKLDPWSGYWLSILDSNIFIKFTIHNYNEENNRELANRDENEWEIIFESTIEGAIDRLTIIGVNEEATSGFDPLYDIAQAPNSPENSFVSFYSHRPEWNNVLGNRFTQDFQYPIQNEEVLEWNMKLESSADSVHLVWDFLNIPEEYEIAYSTDGINYLDLRDVESLVLDGNSNFDIKLGVSVLSNDTKILIPKEFALHQNYPNPFNPATKIRYDLPVDEIVNIAIYDVMGRKIKSLVNTKQVAGYRSITWNATNNFGEQVSAGMYIYVIQAGEFRQTKKMVLLK